MVQDNFLPRQVPLPTMYDLPSDNPEDPGVPDEFHISQPRLIDDTCQPPNLPPNQVFTAIDLNLYYDARHPLWYKRPDWFLVLGTARARRQQDLRLSYVTWQEVLVPFLVVELLSPGTEAEDLGQTLREVNQPPTKWQVYEQLLRVPYYVVYDRYDNQFRAFRHVATRYETIALPNQRLWFEELQLGLGIWQGIYRDTEGAWLRWYDADGNWIPAPTEQVEQERQRAEAERQRAEAERQRADRLAAQLRQLGINPDQF
ncbi:MAG: Uma2 family endonuclease [Elainella sp. Prado103]|jgi:Uma2 family endonuclease|nr:Uma2 family endonuclease [Elainella sp. Prado103]